MFYRRWLVLLTALTLLLLIVLPACGGNDDNETPTASPAATSTPAASPTATLAPTATPSPTATAISFTTITAEPWLKVSDSTTFLPEGPAFDREGNLYFVDVHGNGKVLKVSMADKKVTTIYDPGQGNFSSIDIHKDGRLFICDYPAGKIIAINPDGTGVTDILTSYNGEKIAPDDLIFDHEGNFYFNDMQGTTKNPVGRVFRVSPDFKKIDLVSSGFAINNGISLSPDESQLWLGEYARRALTLLDLGNDGITLSSEAKRVYQFTAGFPDSNAVDSAGNVYQAIIGDGRIAVFDKEGVPVAEIITPGRAELKQLQVTNLAFQPGTDTAFMVAGGKDGAYILTFKGLAKGLTLYSHQ